MIGHERGMDSTTSASRPAQRGDSGFTIVAILILVSLMASLATTFSRHVIVDAQTSVAASTMSESSELIDSQMDYVMQAHRMGRTIEHSKIAAAMASGKLGTDGRIKKAQKQMLVNDLEDDAHSKMFSSIIGDNGLGATRLLETIRVRAVLNASPSTMPSLKYELAWDVLNDPDVEVMEVTSSTTLSNTEFQGVIVIHEGVVLTLNDVIIRGAILSVAAAVGTVPDQYGEFLAPGLLITGMTRILAEDSFPGLAVMMPDGWIRGEHPLARVEIRGDVIAHSITLLTSGSFAGNLATVVAPVFGTNIDRIGEGRAPRTWSPVLDHHGAWQVRQVAVVPTEVDLEDVAAIVGFTLPPKPGDSGAQSVQGEAP